MPLQFGIPYLDELLEVPITLESARQASLRSAPEPESATLIGPDGCGKSVLALHLASRYAADCYASVRQSRNADQAIPRILYISSDFQFAGASTVWISFGLQEPNRRQIPFERTAHGIDRLKYVDFTARLESIKPGDEALAEFLLRSPSDQTQTKIGFLDLARHTAGDDWNFVNTILAQLESVKMPEVGDRRQLRHLVIVDSVAGFETYVGTLDAYGLEQTRRARIAQCMRNTGDHCHIVFVVEEPTEGSRLPEEYVTDVVVRVRSRSTAERALRTIEVEKARARNHALGEHPFEIRGPEGSSTSGWENADAPNCNNAYVQVFHSLPHRKMLVGADPRKGGSSQSQTVCSFGIRYLDELLAAGDAVGAHATNRQIHGLRSASVSAIVGDTSTGKSVLGEKFIAEGFRDVLSDAVRLFALISQPLDDEARHLALSSVSRLGRLLSRSIIATEEPSKWEYLESLRPWENLLEAWRLGSQATQLQLKELAHNPGRERPRFDSPTEAQLAAWTDSFQSLEMREKMFTTLRPPFPGPIVNWVDFLKDWPRPKTRSHFRSPLLEELKGLVDTAASDGSLPPDSAARFVIQLFRHPNLRFPGVLLTTSGQTVQELSHHCLHHLGQTMQGVIHESWPQDHGKETAPALLFAVLWNVLSEQLIVRRFDIENATAPVLFHVLQYNVLEAQRLIHGNAFPPRQTNRALKAQRIRLVVDDLRVLSSLCPAVTSDPAFLPFLTFFLEREGLTSLMVYTDSARPNVRADDPAHQTLQSLLKQVILTWSVPFEGQNKIAVAVVPPSTSTTNGIVRELELVPNKLHPLFANGLRASDLLPNVADCQTVHVTPNFELYSGVVEGRPRPVPLAVYLINANERFELHIEETNNLMREIFTTLSHDKSDQRRVVWALPAKEYWTLRNQAHLPMTVKTQYTTVFQIDAYWSLKAGAGALASQADYLQQDFRVTPGFVSHEDPFDLFHGPPLGSGAKPNDGGIERAWQRRDYFTNSRYQSRVTTFNYQEYATEGMPDRVPFTWDFGFVLARSGPWERFRKKNVHLYFENAMANLFPREVGEVCDRLRDSDRPGDRSVRWREFLGACKTVADSTRLESGDNAVPFDFASTSPETFSCLLLEIWLSELRDVIDNWGAGLRGNVDNWCATHRAWFDELADAEYVPLKEGRNRGVPLDALLADGDDGSGNCGAQDPGIRQRFEKFRDGYLDDLNRTSDFEKAGAWEETRIGHFRSLPIGALCLYKCWLLLLEVLPFDELITHQDFVHPRQPKVASSDSIAARHWYRTACPATARSLAKPVSQDAHMILRMPGRYSARGDSFLASLASSRSRLLAAHAIDLLCSRRANLERLELGVGLPVRDIVGPKCDDVPTALRGIRSEHGRSSERLRELTYGELCDLGGVYGHERTQGRPFWLYRSAFKDYDRVSRVLQKWLARLIRWTISVKAEEGTRWGGGFKAYDYLDTFRFSALIDYPSFLEFAQLCDVLVAEIQSAVRH